MITCGECGFRTHLMVIYLSFDETQQQQVQKYWRGNYQYYQTYQMLNREHTSHNVDLFN